MLVTPAAPPATARTGDVVLIGGLVMPGVSSASAEVFRPATKTFVATGAMADARSGIQAIAFARGTLKHDVVVPGGLSAAVTVDSFGNIQVSFPQKPPNGEIYNSKTGSFTATGLVPTFARVFYTATLLRDGTVLVVGGFPSFLPTAIAEIYDPTTNTFTPTKGPMHEARGLHGATLLPDGTVLIAGGIGTDSGTLSTAELYNPRTGTFRALAQKLPKRMGGHTATLISGCGCSLDGQVLLTGGFASSAAQTGSFDETGTNATVLYDPATETFSAAPALHESRAFHTATLLADGRVLIAGGISGSIRYGFGTMSMDGRPNKAIHATAEIFDPAQQTMTCVGAATAGKCEPSMQSPHIAHSATLLTGSALAGQVLIAGGSGNRIAELFDPGTGQFTAIAGHMKSARAFHAAALIQ